MGELLFKAVVSEKEKEIFIKELQESFQKAYEAEFGKYEKLIIPRKGIEESFNAEGSEIYFAEASGVRVGGTVIVIDKKTFIILLIYCM